MVIDILDNTSKFNLMINQTVVAVGAEIHVETLRKVLQVLNFVQLRVAKSVEEIDLDAQFLIVAVDFTNMPSVQALARFIGGLEGFSGVMSLFVVSPGDLMEQELLFGVELGIKRTFFGPKKDEELRTFIKQHALAVTEYGSLSFIEAEVMKAIARRGEEPLREQCEKLALMDKANEDVNRLQALVYEARGDYKRMEFHLKQTLRINPQNLWAANYLGRFYLRNRRVAEGIEILRKLSRFHELNAARYLALGDAYLNVGHTEKAKVALNTGHKLTNGQDERLAEGLAKVDLMNGDLQAALLKIGKKHFSAQVLAFLNTRAVMAVRAGNVAEGRKLYNEALAGCSPEERVTLAKLWFNLGLACLKLKDYDLALSAFTKSADRGGHEYDRAVKTLDQLKMAMSKAKLGGANKNLRSPLAAMDEIEYESF